MKQHPLTDVQQGLLKGLLLYCEPAGVSIHSGLSFTLVRHVDIGTVLKKVAPILPPTNDVLSTFAWQRLYNRRQGKLTANELSWIAHTATERAEICRSLAVTSFDVWQVRTSKENFSVSKRLPRKVDFESMMMNVYQEFQDNGCVLTVRKGKL